MGREEIGRRLKRVEGQVRGLQRMVEEERECEAILMQLIAARAALDRVGLLVVDSYVEKCLSAPSTDLAQQRLRPVLAMLISRYSLSEPSSGPTADAIDWSAKEE